jgi:ribosome-associated protein
MLRDKEYAERPNKTRLKLVTQHQHNLGKQLTELNLKKLDNIPLSEHFRSSILAVKKLKKGALKRQLKYISALIGAEDVPAIETALQQQNLPDQQEVAVFHQLEQWRDQLITGDKQLLNQLIQQFALIDRQYINQLIRNAVREQKHNKAPKSSRALFRYLKELEQNNSI